jgi:hypothetical protein
MGPSTNLISQNATIYIHIQVSQAKNSEPDDMSHPFDFLLSKEKAGNKDNRGRNPIPPTFHRSEPN